MVRLNIAVEGEGAAFSSVVEQLKKAGLKVERELEPIGTVTGVVDDTDAEVAARIRALAGVRHVEQEGGRKYKVSPPDSKVQ